MKNDEKRVMNNQNLEQLVRDYSDRSRIVSLKKDVLVNG
jgi:hypothetical protein